MNCTYVKQYYEVPADIGRRVMVDGEPGIITEDRGHYIGVTFDADKPGTVRNVHPTSGGHGHHPHDGAITATLS